MKAQEQRKKLNCSKHYDAVIIKTHKTQVQAYFEN